LEQTKAQNYKKRYHVGITYKQLTKECIICGFNKVVGLHHIDENRKNNNSNNLIGLCPNHHQMYHNYRYREEITNLLRNRGYKIELNKDLLRPV